MDSLARIKTQPPPLSRSHSLNSFFADHALSPPASPTASSPAQDLCQNPPSPELPPSPPGSTEIKGQPEACIFVASLSSARSDAQLHDDVSQHFSSWGPLLSVKVSRDWMNRPYAFVQFESQTDAKRALAEGQHSLLHNRRLRLEKARVNRTLFITKFQSSLTHEGSAYSDLKGILETFGPLEELKILKDHSTGGYRDVAFVKFQFREDALRGFSGIRSSLGWTVDWATTPPQKGGGRIDPTTVFVGNLPGSVTREALQEKMEEFGIVESVRLVSARSSFSRPPFAFVSFDSPQGAQTALSLNNQSWKGSVLRVKYKEIDRWNEGYTMGYGLVGYGDFSASSGSMMMDASGVASVPAMGSTPEVPLYMGYPYGAPGYPIATTGYTGTVYYPVPRSYMESVYPPHPTMNMTTGGERNEEESMSGE